jgi:ABC-2 type transport system permease protein
MRPELVGSPFAKWLWDGRRSLVGWALGIAGVGGMYAAFWPTMDDPDMQEAIANYPESILEALNYTDISTAAGYLSATVYGLVVAMLTIVFSVGAGARIVAGDEEAGTLDLILAHPISRRTLVLHRLAAFVAGVVAIAVALLLVLLALTGPARLEGISVGGFAAMNLHLVLFATFFGAVAYAVGAATGSRGLAIGAGAGVAVFGFAANGILNQVEGMAWIKGWSPFDWLNGSAPLKNGVEVSSVLLMAALAAALVAAGTFGFERRDIAV